MGQAAGEQIMLSQAARCQDMADLIGKPAYLGINHGRDRVHDIAQPLAPFGLLEFVDANPQRIFGVVDVDQEIARDHDAAVLQGKAQRLTLVVNLVQHHRHRDRVRRAGDIGGAPAARGFGGETDQLPGRLQPCCDQRQRKG